MRDVLDEWRPIVDEEMARLLPRIVDDDYLVEYFGTPTYEYDAGAVQQCGHEWFGIGGIVQAPALWRIVQRHTETGVARRGNGRYGVKRLGQDPCQPVPT
jgi:hypothetical protein